MYDAINDNRVRPSHLAMDGIIRPVDDPFWAKNAPINGYRCFLPGTKVRGDFKIGLKSLYSGPAIEIIASNGSRLSVTANHPILTDRGWIKACEVNESDYLLCDDVGINSFLPGVINNKNPPSTVEDVFNSLSIEAAGVCDISSFDFHDDMVFREGDVHVAGADSILMHGFKPTIDNSFNNGNLISANHAAKHRCSKHCSFGLPLKLPVIVDAIFSKYPRNISNRCFKVISNRPLTIINALIHSYDIALKYIINNIGSFPGSTALALNTSGGFFNNFPFIDFSIRPATPFNAINSKYSIDNRPGNAKGIGDVFFRFISNIPFANRIIINNSPAFCGRAASYCISFRFSTLFNSSITKESVKKTPADFIGFKHIRDVTAGKVSVNKVAGIRNFSFTGHVYDFETGTGLIVAESIITHNCRCRLISLSEAQAQRRSGNGTGLNKAVVDSEMQPDKGFDYNPGADLLEGVNRAIAQKRSQCGGLFSGMARFGKKSHNLPLWCHGDGAKFLEMIAQAALLSKEMPAPKPVAFQVFDKGKDDKFYLTQFMQQFDAGYNDQVIIEAKTGLHQLLVSDLIFTNHKTNKSKIKKEGREQFMLYIADTINDPTEIRLESGDYGDKSLYFLSQYLIRKEIISVIAVFKQQEKLWTGWSGYQTGSTDYFEGKRKETVLLYRK